MVVILMGVAGSGKTLVGGTLAAALGWRFEDADAYHSAANVAKLGRNVPLTDADRAPWLAALHTLVARAIDRREPLVLACSALKEQYRTALRGGLRYVRFAFLDVDETTLRHRLESRPQHVVGAGLLPSQLAALERPMDALRIDGALPPERIVADIRREFGL